MYRQQHIGLFYLFSSLSYFHLNVKQDEGENCMKKLQILFDPTWGTTGTCFYSWKPTNCLKLSYSNILFLSGCL